MTAIVPIDLRAAKEHLGFGGSGLPPHANSPLA